MSNKGKRNVYLCPDCGHGFITEDVDEGVTPFMTTCQRKGCKGMAQSCFYNIPQDFLARFQPALEWFKPTMAEAVTAGAGVVEHVRKGGLITRPAKKPTEKKT